MIKYLYECSKCKTQELISQSIKDDALTYCKNCESEGLARVITGPMCVMFLDSPKTIQQLGERNFNRLGHYEKEAMLDKNERSIIEGRKRIANGGQP